MVAWHGECDLKAAVMSRLKEHRRLDEIVQGVYFKDGRGCQLGCITHLSERPYEAAERLFGIDQRIGYWLEAVFEGLPEEDCADWVLSSTAAIPVGADLSRCHHHFEVWLLRSNLLSITDTNRDSIARVCELHERALTGVTVADEDWLAARLAAESAVWSAAHSARSAAWSAAHSARSAAWSAAHSARSAAELSWSAAWKQIAQKSIDIFSSAPIVTGQSIDSDVKDELCHRQLWCPDSPKSSFRFEPE